MDTEPGAERPIRRVRVLDEDPELGAELSPDDLQQARTYLVGELAALGVGVHDASEIGSPELLGLLVLDGLLIRGVQVAGRRCGELVGPGSVLRSWDHFGQFSPMPFEVSWRVVTPVRLVLLDQRLITVSARWPTLMHNLCRRAVERSHALALNVAIHCLQHVELRLLVLLWHLAERFGRVTSRGTIVPLKLTHGDLAELIRNQRPSVSARLSALSAAGQVARLPDRTWLLRGQPPEDLQDIRIRAAAAVPEADSMTGPAS